MADPELVKILKQGREAWNRWRKLHPGERPDLNGADLSEADLSFADLHNADLTSANLDGANLDNANLDGADLHHAKLYDAFLVETNLSHTHLGRADLHGSDLVSANLKDANLSEANLNSADLRYANLDSADLRSANLSLANLINADLSFANLSGAILDGTSMGSIDLRNTEGISEIRHDGPSHVNLHTMQLPSDDTTLHFLRGVGVPNQWIDDYRVHLMHPIQYHSCFISYASSDGTLAQRLHADLQNCGVRCWFALEDMKTGDKIRSRIDEAIHVHEKLLLLLSESAIKSNWVEDEVEAALEKEENQHCEVLFPIRLDDAVMETRQAWAATLRRTRHIGDFTRWMEPEEYQQAFERLLHDLKKAGE